MKVFRTVAAVVGLGFGMSSFGMGSVDVEAQQAPPEQSAECGSCLGDEVRGALNGQDRKIARYAGRLVGAAVATATGVMGFLHFRDAVHSYDSYPASDLKDDVKADVNSAEHFTRLTLGFAGISFVGSAVRYFASKCSNVRMNLSWLMGGGHAVSFVNGVVAVVTAYLAYRETEDIEAWNSFNNHAAAFMYALGISTFASAHTAMGEFWDAFHAHE